MNEPKPYSPFIGCQLVEKIKSFNDDTTIIDLAFINNIKIIKNNKLIAEQQIINDNFVTKEFAMCRILIFH